MDPKTTYGAYPYKTKEQEKEDENQLMSVTAMLRESEEKYRRLLDLCPDAVVILQDGKYLFASSAFTRIFGYNRQDIDRGLTIFDQLQAEDLPALRRQFEDRLSGKPVRRTFRINLASKSGALIPCETSAILIQVNERPANLMIVREISERISAEAANNTREETMRGLLNSTHDLVLLVNTDGTVLTVNNVAAERFGKDPEELVGENIYPLMPAEVVELRKHKAEEVIRTKQPVQYIEENAGKCFDCNLFPILDNNGNVQSFTVFVKDITDRRQYEQALQDVREELEQRVRERTRELEEKAEKLEDVNTALKVLLKRLDEDKQVLEEKIMFNMSRLIEPFLEKLKKSKLTNRQKALLDILECNLNEIVSPFARGYSNSFMKFTPTEIQVADLIRQGRTTKEIAGLLNLSSKTIEFHRENIRSKIGIKNKKINLRTYLLSSK